MKAEILAIGTELLLGDVVNSNAAWISQALIREGVDVYYHDTVGDNPGRIQGILAQALQRSDVLIFTGGLGPTDDDLTVATLATYFEVPLVEDADSRQTIEQMFIARGMPMSPTNIKQALRPADAQVIPNPVGTAPGVFWDVSARLPEKTTPTLILCFPGVPRELYAMWPNGMAKLEAYLPQAGRQKLVTERLRFFGIGESKLGEQLRDVMAAEHLTVAPYVKNGEVEIRIATKAETLEAGETAIAPVKAEILRRVGHYCYGENDDSLERVVGKLLLSQQKSIGVAESCTGGLVSSRLTDVPGSSAYIRLNVVTYSNDAKIQLLNVSKDVLIKHGAVSEPVAAAMAEGMLGLAKTDIAVSLTGIAGPDGGTEEKPVGLVYIGIAQRDVATRVEKVQVNARYDRETIKYWFSQYALNLVRETLLTNAQS